MKHLCLRPVATLLQTLAKCAKMIPVMLWGALILHKVYKPKVRPHR